jgi:hypothetical protein
VSKSMICSNRQSSARRDAPSIRPREKQLKSEPTAVAVALALLHLLKRLPAMMGRFHLLGKLDKKFQVI